MTVFHIWSRRSGALYGARKSSPVLHTGGTIRAQDSRDLGSKHISILSLFVKSHDPLVMASLHHPSGPRDTWLVATATAGRMRSGHFSRRKKKGAPQPFCLRRRRYENGILPVAPAPVCAGPKLLAIIEIGRAPISVEEASSTGRRDSAMETR